MKLNKINEWLFTVHAVQFPLAQYCDMTPEGLKCAVREAQQKRPLLDNG